MHARTGVQGDHLGLPVRQVNVEHSRLVLDPDLHPLARALVLNERADSGSEHHPVPALDHPGSGRQRLPDLSHDEFYHTGAGHLPVLVCFNREHLEPIPDLHVLLRVDALCQPLVSTMTQVFSSSYSSTAPTIQTPPKERPPSHPLPRRHSRRGSGTRSLGAPAGHTGSKIP